MNHRKPASMPSRSSSEVASSEVYVPKMQHEPRSSYTNRLTVHGGQQQHHKPRPTQRRNRRGRPTDWSLGFIQGDGDEVRPTSVHAVGSKVNEARVGRVRRVCRVFSCPDPLAIDEELDRTFI